MVLRRPCQSRDSTRKPKKKCVKKKFLFTDGPSQRVLRSRPNLRSGPMPCQDGIRISTLALLLLLLPHRHMLRIYQIEQQILRHALARPLAPRDKGCTRDTVLGSSSAPAGGMWGRHWLCEGEGFFYPLTDGTRRCASQTRVSDTPRRRCTSRREGGSRAPWRRCASPTGTRCGTCP